MAFTTANIGLRVWDLATDDFSRSELANNWTALDKHDHSSGRGVQVPTGGIFNSAITNAKIADSAVNTIKLADGAVTGIKLADNSVASTHIQDNAVITTKITDSAVGTTKIADSAVTTLKLNDGAVTASKLADSSVTTTKLQSVSVTEPKVATDAVSTRTIIDRNVTEPKLATPAVNTANIYPGAITSEKLAAGVIPVGQIIQWWRPSDLTPIPAGWLVCDGQTVLAGNHDFAEGTSITLPDLRNRFILGAALTGTGTGTDVPPPERQTGGSHTQSNVHSHTIAGHSHTVNSHSHSIEMNTHRHFFSSTPPDYAPRGGDLPHGHADTLKNPRQRGGAVYGNLPEARRQALYVPGLNFFEEYGEDVGAPMSEYSHAHGQATGNTAPGTDVVAQSTGTSGGTTDTRPRYIGVLFLIKVKN